MNRLVVKHDRTETPADGKGAFMLTPGSKDFLIERRIRESPVITKSFVAND